MSNETLINIESASASDALDYAKYKYFAQLARAEGQEATALLFDAIADKKLVSALSHLKLSLGSISTKEALEKAVEGETYEYEVMYPHFKETAEFERRLAASNSRPEFSELLTKAEQQFAEAVAVASTNASMYATMLENLPKR